MPSNPLGKSILAPISRALFPIERPEPLQAYEGTKADRQGYIVRTRWMAPYKSLYKVIFVAAHLRHTCGTVFHKHSRH